MKLICKKLSTETNLKQLFRFANGAETASVEYGSWGKENTRDQASTR